MPQASIKGEMCKLVKGNGFSKYGKRKNKDFDGEW